MAGIYIHIPFCKKACTYCNFHFSTSRQLQNDFLQALLKEIRLRKQYLDDAEVETIYFGGGTPSITPPEQIRQILEEIRLHFNVSEQAEVTLEANPDDISPSSVADWFASGINRLSIGIQSFHENDLRWMNRAHNVQQALDCIDIARAYFKALTIDLIYGTPLLTDEKWHHNIQTALEKGIPHLSCYALTTEEGTALHHQIKKGLQAEPLQEDQARQFEWLMSTMETNGYEHYEISNFALPGHRSRHNSSYWKEQPYLGLGPSAHSYNGIARQWNIGNNAIYIQQMKENILPVEEEILSAAQQANEYIMLSLRTHEGIDLSRLHMKLNEKGLRKFEIKAGIHRQKGLLEQTETKIILTRSGKLFADGIAADLFVEDSHCTLI